MSLFDRHFLPEHPRHTNIIRIYDFQAKFLKYVNKNYYEPWEYNMHPLVISMPTDNIVIFFILLLSRKGYSIDVWGNINKWHCEVRQQVLLRTLIFKNTNFWKLFQTVALGLLSNLVLRTINNFCFCFIFSIPWSTLRENCPNTELFLIRIFLNSDWIWRDKVYLSVFSQNTEKYGPETTPYLDTFVFSPNTGKFGPEITSYLDTFHAVLVFLNFPADYN